MRYFVTNKKQAQALSKRKQGRQFGLGAEHRMTNVIEVLIWNPRFRQFLPFAFINKTYLELDEKSPNYPDDTSLYYLINFPPYK